MQRPGAFAARSRWLGYAAILLVIRLALYVVVKDIACTVYFTLKVGMTRVLSVEGCYEKVAEVP